MIDWLLERVVVCPSGCWLWAGALSGLTGRGAGYPKANDGGGTFYVHRRVYETFNGPIPAGFQVDHLCAAWSAFPFMNRRCVNPDHLEAVPHAVNQQRRISLQRKRQRACLQALRNEIARDGFVCKEVVVLLPDLSGGLCDPSPGGVS